MGERCDLRPTKHAKDQAIERGVAKEEILETILKGAKRAKGGKIISFFRKLEVVYVQRPCRYFVITQYWR